MTDIEFAAEVSRLKANWPKLGDDFIAEVRRKWGDLPHETFSAAVAIVLARQTGFLKLGHLYAAVREVFDSMPKRHALRWDTCDSCASSGYLDVFYFHGPNDDPYQSLAACRDCNPAGYSFAPAPDQRIVNVAEWWRAVCALQATLHSTGHHDPKCDINHAEEPIPKLYATDWRAVAAKIRKDAKQAASNALAGSPSCP